jgi:hypothetical protein
MNMTLQNFPDHQLLSELEVLKKIKKALKYKKPFSLIRIGDGENIILAQGKFMTENEVLNSYWVKQSESGKGKGVTLPCLKLRDQIISLIPKADVVGVCRIKNDEVSVIGKYKRELTNKIFDFYHLNPPNLCHVFVNRKMVSHRLFWELIHQYRTLLISKWAERYAKIILKQYAKINPNIVGCIDFTHYDQIPDTLSQVGKYKFDLALISAGVNSLILAPQIAQLYGKVAIDFGKTMMYTVLPNRRIKPWRPK